jgi:hypothetical protein
LARAGNGRGFEVDEFGADYFSPNLSTTYRAPSGDWLVNYRGTNVSFAIAFQPLSQLVLAVPSVNVAGGVLKSVSWV